MNYETFTWIQIKDGQMRIGGATDKEFRPSRNQNSSNLASKHHREQPSRPGRSLWRQELQASTNRHWLDLLPLPPNTQLPSQFLRQPIYIERDPTRTGQLLLF